MPGVPPDEALTSTVTVCIWPLWTLGVGNTCYPSQRRRQAVHPPEKVALEWARDTVVAWVASPGDRLGLRLPGLTLVLLQMTHRPHTSVLGGTPATRLMTLDRRMVTHNLTSCAWPDHPLTLSLGDFLGKVGVNTQSSRHSCGDTVVSYTPSSLGLWGEQRRPEAVRVCTHVGAQTHTQTHTPYGFCFSGEQSIQACYSALCASVSFPIKQG